MSVTYSVFEKDGEVFFARSVATPEEAATFIAPKATAVGLPDWLMNAEPGQRFDEQGNRVDTDPDWGTEEIRSAAEYEPETQVHVVADANRDAVKILFMTAFEQASDSINGEALSQAVGDMDEAAIAAELEDVIEVMRLALEKKLSPLLLSILVGGGNAGMSMLEPRVAEMRAARTLRDVFTATDPRAIAWALVHAGLLIKDILETTRQEIAEAVAAGLSGEASRPEVVKSIFEIIEDEERAELIAHTETMKAANKGLTLAWEQAVTKGLLPPNVLKMWIATGDDNMCEECAEVNGEKVPLSSVFSVGEDPPLHPNCRCTMGISE